MRELPETSEFLDRLRRRDPEACRLMITTFGPDLEGYATHLLGDREQVDDLVQESLTSALEALPGFDGRSRIRTWLFSIVHHKAVDRIRRSQRSRAREVPLESEDPLEGTFDARGQRSERLRDWSPGPEELLESGRLRERLAQAASELPERNREAFLLRDVHGMETDEASAVMGVTRSHFRVLLHRARVALREKLARDRGEDRR